jgi:hypothetical protein
MKSTAISIVLMIAAAAAIAQTNTFPSSGNVGIGTLAPQNPLDVYGYIRSVVMPPNDSTPALSGHLWSNRGPGGGEYKWGMFMASAEGAYGLAPNGLELYEYPNTGQPSCCIPRLRILKSSTSTIPYPVVIDGLGHFGVGVWTPGPYNFEVAGTSHFTGNITVDGNINAKYQDIAEWVPASESMSPGTVVVINPKAANGVRPSRRAYDTGVAGVVSDQPGVILGEAGDSKAKVATTGRVKVHVDAANGAIEPGDLLVTSDRPGVAMKSAPVEVAGVKMHRPGTLIGKALEPLRGGDGDILVLLSLQ